MEFVANLILAAKLQNLEGALLDQLVVLGDEGFVDQKGEQHFFVNLLNLRKSEIINFNRNQGGTAEGQALVEFQLEQPPVGLLLDQVGSKQPVNVKVELEVRRAGLPLSQNLSNPGPEKLVPALQKQMIGQSVRALLQQLQGASEHILVSVLVVHNQVEGRVEVPGPPTLLQI